MRENWARRMVRSEIGRAYYPAQLRDALAFVNSLSDDEIIDRIEGLGGGVDQFINDHPEEG